MGLTVERRWQYRISELRTDQKNISNLNNKKKIDLKKEKRTDLRNLSNNNKNSKFLMLMEREKEWVERI